MGKSDNIIDFKSYIQYLRRVTGEPWEPDKLGRSIVNKVVKVQRVNKVYGILKRVSVAVAAAAMLAGAGWFAFGLSNDRNECSGTLTTVSGQKADKLFYPIETFERRFRWFYTDYDCTVLFTSIRDILPLPLDAYMTPEQEEIYFRGHNVSEGRNGREMYDMLRGLDSRFVSWYSDAVFFKMCDIFEPYCTPTQKEVLDTCKDDFLSSTDMKALLDMKPAEFEAILAGLAPKEGFGNIYKLNSEDIDAIYERESAILSYFDHSFVYILSVPGTYSSGNADEFIDGRPSWRVDAVRLLSGDIVAESHFRRINIWAIFITLAAAGVLISVLFRRFK